MIRGYFLPIETINGTEQVAGTELIHDALLRTTGIPNVRLLIMDTTDSEHAQLTILALELHDLTQEEIDFYHSHVMPYEPDPDTIRAEELLASSSSAITMPEIWELLRIIGKRMGYRY